MATSKIKDRGLNVLSIVSSAEAISSGTATSVAQLTITKGTWLFIGMGSFYNNPTGERWLSISTTVTKFPSRRQVTYLPASSTDGTVVQTVTVETVSSDTTYNLNAWQNSGSAITVAPSFFAIRLA